MEMSSQVIDAAQNQRAIIGFWLTVGGFILLAVYTAATIWQAFLTRKAIKAAGESSKAALDETRKSNEHMIAARRAWLVPAGLNGNNPQGLFMTLKNCGGMPATKVQMMAEGFMKKGETLVPIKAEVGTGVRRTLGNGEGVEVGIVLDLPEDHTGFLQIKAKVLYNDGFETRGVKAEYVWASGKWWSALEELL